MIDAEARGAMGLFFESGVGWLWLWFMIGGKNLGHPLNQSDAILSLRPTHVFWHCGWFVRFYFEFLVAPCYWLLK